MCTILFPSARRLGRRPTDQFIHARAYIFENDPRNVRTDDSFLCTRDTYTARAGIFRENYSLVLWTPRRRYRGRSVHVPETRGAHFTPSPPNRPVQRFTLFPYPLTFENVGRFYFWNHRACRRRRTRAHTVYTIERAPIHLIARAHTHTGRNNV